MAKIETLYIPKNNDDQESQTLVDVNEKLFDTLRKCFQSGHINFIIGSGASMPATPLMGDIEKKLESLYKDKKDTEAEAKEKEFLKTIKPSMDALIDPSKAETEQKGKNDGVLKTYQSFLGNLEEILNERKNPILPKQVNIFTTNYDLFIEKASESSEGLILNDGFLRSPSIKQNYEFDSQSFFNAVYHNGNVYNYRVELPTINLIKVHGSCSWRKADSARIVFRVDTETPYEDGTLGVILPRKQKFQETILNQVHYDLLRLYANELDRENALLIAFGFSFADEHILDITKRALKNPTLKLVIFSYSKEESKDYHDKFLGHSNVLIIMPEEGNIRFDRLNEVLSHIPPLRVEPKIKVEVKNA